MNTKLNTFIFPPLKPVLVFILIVLLSGCDKKVNVVTAEPETPHQIVLLQDKLPHGNMAPKLAIIPAGNNTLGDIAGVGLPRERPTYEVIIDKPFAMGVYEVTFDEYDLFCDETGRDKPQDEGWGRNQRPVINVTRNDALDYVRWLSKQTGEKYFLPSESQWEYAARAGTQTNYWWGDEPGDKNAQCGNCATIHRCEECKDIPSLTEGTVIVGSFKANPFGLYDVHGNVMEWVTDCWIDTNPARPSDGTSRRSGDCSRPVIRDGSWLNNVRFIRASVRSRAVDGLDYKSFRVGFRVARQVKNDS